MKVNRFGVCGSDDIGSSKSKTLDLDPEYFEAVRVYNDFKKLREKMGKPLRGFASREEAIIDLYGDIPNNLGKKHQIRIFCT